MRKTILRVVPFHKSWAVMEDGIDRAKKYFRTQEEALAYGKIQAAKKLTKVMIHDEKGTCVGSISFCKRTLRSEEKGKRMRREVFQVDYYGACVDDPGEPGIMTSGALSYLETVYESLMRLHYEVAPVLTEILP